MPFQPFTAWCKTDVNFKERYYASEEFKGEQACCGVIRN